MRDLNFEEGSVLQVEGGGRAGVEGVRVQVRPRVSLADAYVGPRVSDESAGHPGFRVTLGSSGICTTPARGSCGS